MPKQVQRSLLLACGSMVLSSPLLGQNAARVEAPAIEDEKTARPNIVLILADDLSFSDLGAFGSEIQTPNLDRLAERGMKFSNYHTAPSCAPSRAMLLTGVNSHRAGVPNIPEALPPEQEVFDNYDGVLSSNVATVASRLNTEGYHSYMAGKWHLGKTEDLLPYNRGFERTLSMADTGADNWEQRPYLPVYDHANWTRDGKPTQLEEPLYSSELLVDEMISYIESNQGDGQPFFSYLSFLAVHLPMQAPREFTERYIETYADGWEKLRESRHAGTIAAGLVPADSQRVEHDFIDDWDALSETDKRLESKRMAVYAGMVSAMDFHIGRLLDYLEASGELDNTVIIFTSDNGPEFGTLPPGILRSQGYTHTYDNLGEIGSASFLGPNFANAAASPLSYFKFYMGEGGQRVPLIISGPGIQAQKGFIKASTHVIDLTPTILSLAGIEEQTGRFGGREVEPITGRDLTPLLRGDAEEVYGANDYVGYEVAGNASLFSGRYKIVMNRQPLGDSTWRMYDIVADPGETRDLSAEYPVQFQRMLNLYIRYTRENGVQPVPENYMQETEINNQNLHELFRDRILVGLLTALALGFFALLAVQRKKR
ncbi:MAG: arylsulfatase [Spirochaetes bacterium]|nr:arylsulfatase [Spirochaetota bacterium]MBU0954035.1 arylsulfatase [Spirochaetota bacterium]